MSIDGGNNRLDGNMIRAGVARLGKYRSNSGSPGYLLKPFYDFPFGLF
jgi:hypothetical protein